MHSKPLPWPPKPNRLVQWWYTPTAAQWLALPYHAAPRIKLIDQWVEGFKQAPARNKRCWVEGLIYLGEQALPTDSFNLWTRFLKRMLQVPDGLEALLELRGLLLDAGFGPGLMQTIDRILALLFDPKALQLHAMPACRCRLQWPRYFGREALPDYLTKPIPELTVWQFVHPFVQQAVLCLPLVACGQGLAHLLEVRYTHAGLRGFLGAGGFVSQLYQQLTVAGNRRPLLWTGITLPDTQLPVARVDAAWVAQHPALVWHIQQGAQLESIQAQPKGVLCQLRYEYERLAWVQSEWAMDRLVWC